MIVGSKELIRDINNNIVLETIIHKSPISRAALSKTLGLTKATISAIVQDLIQRKLVIEIGSDNTDLGRKPILLTFNKDIGYALCIDIKSNKSRAIVSNLQAELLSDLTYDTPPVLNNLSSFVSAIIADAKSNLPDSEYGLIGITLSIHSFLSPSPNNVSKVNKLDTTQLVNDLSHTFDIPIYIDNSFNLSVLGEYMFSYDNPNIASLNIYDHIGLGLIINNHLIKGRYLTSGEYGHTIIQMNGKECYCGNHGCLEQYIGENNLLQLFVAQKNCEPISFAEYAEYYFNQDSTAQTIYNQFIDYLETSINNILNSVNPDILIVNSSFTSYFPEIIQKINKRLFSDSEKHTLIVPSTLQDKASLLGGVGVAIRDFLGIKYLKLHQFFEDKLV